MLITLSHLLKQAPQLLLVTFLLSCSSPKTVDGFDSAAWKNDPHGCKGERAGIWNNFASRKAELMGFNETDLKNLLGKAEKIHLPDKGQKVYYYYISGSEKCGGSQDKTPLQLQIRINATNNVSEVQVITDLL